MPHQFPTAQETLDQAQNPAPQWPSQEAHEWFHTAALNGPGSSGKQASEQWQARKAELISQAQRDLQDAYDGVAEFGPDGPKKVSTLGMEKWFNAPAWATLGMAGIALGAEAGKAGVAVMGAMAIGKVVHDYKLRGHYNQAVDSFRQFRDDLELSETLEQCEQAIKGAYDRARARPMGWGEVSDDLKHLGAGVVLATVAVGTFVASVVAPDLITALGPTKIATASAIMAATGGMLAGHDATAKAREKMTQRALGRVLEFGCRLDERRAGGMADPGIEPGSPKMPGIGS